MPEKSIGDIEGIRREAWRMVPEIMAFTRIAMDSLVEIDGFLDVADLSDAERVAAARSVIQESIQRIGPLSVDLVRQRRDIMDALLRLDQQGVKLPAELVVLVGKFRQTYKALTGGE